jgi:hypothetical protein
MFVFGPAVQVVVYAFVATARTHNTPQAPANSAALCVRSERPFALYGRRAAVLDFNGDGKADLLLSGPRDTTAAQHTLTPTTTHVRVLSLQCVLSCRVSCV